MTFRTILGGTDATPEGGWAAATAWRLANEIDGTAVLIHAVSDAWMPPTPWVAVPGEELRRHVLTHARTLVRCALADHAPQACLDRLEVEFGSAAQVLADRAEAVGASLIVLGGKRHSGLGRWLAGSTAHQLLRASDLPLLVATPSVAQIRRILVAVDLDETAAATIAAAENLAGRLHAALRFVHAVEPIPYATDLERLVDLNAMHEATIMALDDTVWPLIADPQAERVVRDGMPTAVIEIEARSWSADLVVIGHHGRGRWDRAVLGSVSYDLLHELPASLMIVHAQPAATRTSPVTAASGAR